MTSLMSSHTWVKWINWPSERREIGWKEEGILVWKENFMSSYWEEDHLFCTIYHFDSEWERDHGTGEKHLLEPFWTFLPGRSYKLYILGIHSYRPPSTCLYPTPSLLRPHPYQSKGRRAFSRIVSRPGRGWGVGKDERRASWATIILGNFCTHSAYTYKEMTYLTYGNSGSWFEYKKGHWMQRQDPGQPWEKSPERGFWLPKNKHCFLTHRQPAVLGPEDQ